MKTDRALLLMCLLTLAAGCGDDVASVDREPPPVPAGVYSVTGDGEVELHWSPLVGSDVAGYDVYASANPDPSGATRIARVYGAGSALYVDSGLENGVTQYYWVLAFDVSGNESGLSSEFVHDTPRPAGTGLVLYAASERPARAAVDWSRHTKGNAGLAVSFDDPQADYIVLEDAANGLLFLAGTLISSEGNTYENNIQDFGYTESLGEVDWAPDVGWASSPDGVELILGHSYIVWTWDDYFAKFRVTQKTARSVTLDWAYQATEDFENRFELVARPMAKAPR